MKRIRIGNDINVAWSILQKDGTPFSLEGRDVNVFLRTPFGKQEVSDYIINNNVIEWTFLGKTQKVKGCYSLILVINEGANGMITTDSCDFVNLVSCSCQVGGEDNDGVQTEAIELTSTLGVIAYDDTEIRNNITEIESELTELSAEVSGLSEGIALRNVGAEDTDESVEEPEIPAPTPSASNEWKCVYDGRPEVGVDGFNIETYSDGTPLKAQEAIVQILIDTQADSNKNGYVYIKSTTNKTIWNAFGVIDFQNTSASADNKFLQQIHFKASPIMYMVADIYNKMQGAVNSNVEIKAGIGSEGPQVYEDITFIRLVVNGPITTPPLIKVFVR